MGRIYDFFHSRWFDAHYKTKVHMGQMALVVLTIALSGARIATKPKGMPTTRSDTLAITMSIKTIVVLCYQLITEHVSRYKRWGSLKAYAVLNTMEIVFWFVVVIIGFMGMSNYCKGANCAMSVFVALTAIVLMAFAFWTAVCSWLNYRYFKRYEVHRETALPEQRPDYGYPVMDSSASGQSLRK